MTSYFRLLAGLTSLMSALCLRHLSASGPEGTLESSVAMVGGAKLAGNVQGRDLARARLEPARENGTGDRKVEKEIQCAERHRDDAQTARPFVRAQAERLEQAVKAMQEVEAQQT